MTARVLMPRAPPRAPPSRRRGRSRAGAGARARAAPRHASPTTCGQRTTSPSWRGTPAGSSSRPSIGNESTSVASSMPEVLALQRAALVRADERDPELAVLDPLGREHAAGRASAAAAAVDLERRCGSSTSTSTTSAACAACPVASACVPVRLDDPLDELVPDDVGVARTRRTRSRRSSRGCPAPGSAPTPGSRGRSICVTSPVTTILRAEAEPRQEHLHLLGARVLRLVEDDEASRSASGRA